MKRVRPLRWVCLLGLPLLVGGCVSDVLPQTSDPSCLLLCALQRAITGEPAEVPVPVAAVPAAPRPRAGVARPKQAAVAKPAVQPAVLAHARPIRRKPQAQVSVVRQTPAHALRPTTATMVPQGPAPVAVAPPPAPAQPAQSLTQAIPGSVGIVAPVLQGH